jgi:hypothetical protein
MGLRAIVLNRRSSIRVRAGIVRELPSEDGGSMGSRPAVHYGSRGLVHLSPEGGSEGSEIVPLGHAPALIRSAGVARGAVTFLW